MSVRRIIPWIVGLCVLAGCGDNASSSSATTSITLSGAVNAVVTSTTCNPLKAGELALMSNVTIGNQGYVFGVVVLNAVGGGTFTGKQVSGILDGDSTNKGGEVTWLTQSAPTSNSQTVTAAADLKSGSVDLTLVTQGTSAPTEHAKGSWFCS